MGWIAAFFVGLLGWLVTHDIRARETALAAARVHRDRRPGTYWAIMTFWVTCLMLSALLALGNYLYQTNCTGEPCTIVVTIVPQ
jgi:hypothetical protein